MSKSGAVEKTRTSTGCYPTAPSTLRVYQFRHDRVEREIANPPRPGKANLPGAAPAVGERLALEGTHRVGYGDGDMIADDHHLAARDKAIVGVDPGIVLDRRFELDYRAATHFQQLMDRHRGLAEDDGHLDRDVVDRFLAGLHRVFILYNQRRRHSSIGYRTPAQARSDMTIAQAA